MGEKIGWGNNLDMDIGMADNETQQNQKKLISKMYE